MIGGEHFVPLTGALLREWAAKGVLMREFKAWVASLGGTVLQRAEPVGSFTEKLQKAITAGEDLAPILSQRGAPAPEPLTWAEIGLPPGKATGLGKATWVFVLSHDGYSCTERIEVLGPRGGTRGTTRIGWTFERLEDNTNGAWFVPPNQACGAFRLSQYGWENTKYLWLWGYDNVACCQSDFNYLHYAITHHALLADILASMFNAMLQHLSPMVPQPEEPVVEAPAPPPPTFATELALHQTKMVERTANRIEEGKARIAELQATIEAQQAEVIRLSKPTPPVEDLASGLQAILDQGLCSAIKQDKRGLWFLFDDIYTVVDERLAALGKSRGHTNAIPGIYRINPVVVHMPWGRSGSGWTCATPEGERHAHKHAGNAGAWGRPCLGDQKGSLGPEGVNNSTWFSMLWDHDIVAWAKAIHAFMGRTEWESRPDHYNPIWTCATLVESHAPKEPKIEVKKLPTPTITVTVTRRPAPEEAEQHA